MLFYDEIRVISLAYRPFWFIWIDIDTVLRVQRISSPRYELAKLQIFAFPKVDFPSRLARRRR